MVFVGWVALLCILLQIMTYKDELQGQSGPGFHWLLFDNSADTAIAPRSTSSDFFTLLDDDTERVRIDHLVV